MSQQQSQISNINIDDVQSDESVSQVVIIIGDDDDDIYNTQPSSLFEGGSGNPKMNLFMVRSTDNVEEANFLISEEFIVIAQMQVELMLVQVSKLPVTSRKFSSCQKPSDCGSMSTV